MHLRHKDFDSTQTEVKAMEHLREKVKEVFNDEDMAFAYSRFYLEWETNKVKKMPDLLLFFSASECTLKSFVMPHVTR